MEEEQNIDYMRAATECRLKEIPPSSISQGTEEASTAFRLVENLYFAEVRNHKGEEPFPPLLDFIQEVADQYSLKRRNAILQGSIDEALDAEEMSYRWNRIGNLLSTEGK